MKFFWNPCAHQLFTLFSHIRHTGVIHRKKNISTFFKNSVDRCKTPVLVSAHIQKHMSDRPGKKFIGAYIDEETKDKLQRIAALEDRSLAYIVEKILSAGVLHLKAKPAKLAFK